MFLESVDETVSSVLVEDLLSSVFIEDLRSDMAKADTLEELVDLSRAELTMEEEADLRTVLAADTGEEQDWPVELVCAAEEEAVVAKRFEEYRSWLLNNSVSVKFFLCVVVEVVRGSS